MQDKILVNLSEDHTYQCTTDIIGREGEGNASQLVISIPEKFIGSSVYLDFEKPSGEKFRTPRLEVKDGVAVYNVVPYLLTERGQIKVQVIFITESGQTWKSSVKRYINKYSINAEDAIPEKEDFIFEAQKLLDELSKEKFVLSINGIEPDENGNIELDIYSAVDDALFNAKVNGEFDGKDGYTPIKGVDYFDGVDGVDGVDGKDGKDGYTPIKGVDYFDGVDGKDGKDGKDGIDGRDGYTPEKGVDYFDGENGVSPTVSVSKTGKETTITITDKDGTHTATILDGEGEGSAEGAVLYTPQTLTEEQKEQARENIGAVSAEEVEAIVNPPVNEFSETGEVVELNVDTDTPLSVVSKIHRDSTWGLSDQLVLHQVSGSNFFDLTTYLGGVGTVFTKNGITATVNADDTVTIKGTNEINGWTHIIQAERGGEDARKIYPAGTYTIPAGFMLQVREAQYPTEVSMTELPVNLENTVTIPRPFRIKRITYAVRANATVDLTLPLGLFRGNSIPASGYEYRGNTYTTNFTDQVYEGEFNLGTGELKDADGNTVAYYEPHEINSLSGTNYFWTGFGECTVANVAAEAERVVLCTPQTLDDWHKTQARENIGAASIDVEYQTITTDLAYSHEGLPKGEKTVNVQSDGVFGDNCYAYAGVDLVPRKTFNRKFPYEGITITRNGMTYHLEGTATVQTGVVFTHDPSQSQSPIDSRISGKKLKLTTLSNLIHGNDITLRIQFFDAEGKILNLVRADGSTSTWDATYIGRSAKVHSTTFTAPTGVFYATLSISVPANEYNFDFQFYLTEVDLTSSVSITEPTLIANASDSNNVLTFPYQSTITVIAPIAEYVKYMARNAKGDRATYLMPESFGAVGDGYADDSEAIALCLATALETKQTVLMAKKYCITSPIVLSDDGLNIIANDIVYNGTDTAIEISGQKNTLKVHSIKSSGIGISYRSYNNKMVLYNDVEINTIDSASHGIALYSSSHGIYQNTVKFNLISAGGSGTYGICGLKTEGGSYVTENNFYGGHIANCDWAVYNVGGNSRFYGIQVEGNVQGGFYIVGHITIFNPRMAETWRDGRFPYFKIMKTKYVNIYLATALPINEIDLSECKETWESSDGIIQAETECYASVIHGTIIPRTPGVGQNVDANTYYTDKTYIWGKRLIMTPTIPYKKVVTTEVLDTRLIGRTEETDEEIYTLSQLPTKFIVDNTNTEIYLHASYCAFGFNEFEVEQANGFTCKIYDFDQNLIFDGTERGNGTYKITVYKDGSLAEQHLGNMWLDNLNQYWEVSKIAPAADLEQRLAALEALINGS